jgi:hypothetical protein
MNPSFNLSSSHDQRAMASCEGIQCVAMTVEHPE